MLDDACQCCLPSSAESAAQGVNGGYGANRRSSKLLERVSRDYRFVFLSVIAACRVHVWHLRLRTGSCLLRRLK